MVLHWLILTFISTSEVSQFCLILVLLQLNSDIWINTIFASDGRQSKTLILSTNVDQTSLETEFSTAICRQSGDKWQSKTLLIAIFDPRSSVVKNVFDCRLSGAEKIVTRYMTPQTMQLTYKSINQETFQEEGLNSLHAG